jgi:hypothetical protein
MRQYACADCFHTSQSRFLGDEIASTWGCKGSVVTRRARKKRSSGQNHAIVDAGRAVWAPRLRSISNVSSTSVCSCRRSTRHTRPNTERCQRPLECPSTETFERKNRARNHALLPRSVRFRSPSGALVPDGRGRWCRRGYEGDQLPALKAGVWAPNCQLFLRRRSVPAFIRSRRWSVCSQPSPPQSRSRRRR